MVARHMYSKSCMRYIIFRTCNIRCTKLRKPVSKNIVDSVDRFRMKQNGNQAWRDYDSGDRVHQTKYHFHDCFMDENSCIPNELNDDYLNLYCKCKLVPVFKRWAYIYKSVFSHRFCADYLQSGCNLENGSIHSKNMAFYHAIPWVNDIFMVSPFKQVTIEESLKIKNKRVPEDEWKFIKYDPQYYREE